MNGYFIIILLSFIELIRAWKIDDRLSLITLLISIISIVLFMIDNDKKKQT